MGLETDWGAWQMNELTLMVGRRVERNLNEGKDAFAGFSFSSNGQKGYRSAKHLVTKKVKINPDGTW